MTIDRIFLAFMVLVGLAIGLLLVAAPETRDYRVPPYYWVIIAMAIFELVAFARARGTPGTMITMQARLLGLVLAVFVMVLVPVLAGSPGRLF